MKRYFRSLLEFRREELPQLIPLFLHYFFLILTSYILKIPARFSEQLDRKVFEPVSSPPNGIKLGETLSPFPKRLLHKGQCYSPYLVCDGSLFPGFRRGPFSPNFNREEGFGYSRRTQSLIAGFIGTCGPGGGADHDDGVRFH